MPLTLIRLALAIAVFVAGFALLVLHYTLWHDPAAGYASLLACVFVAELIRP